MDVLSIVGIILGFSFLIIVHEHGHFLVARAFGMRVDRYLIGIGPTVFKYQPKDSPTIYQVGAIPVLAGVMIAGMNPFEDFDEKDPAIYGNATPIARVLTVAAGPAANYLFAMLLAFVIGLLGWPDDLLSQMEPNYPALENQKVEVGALMEGMPASAAGLKLGDEVVAVNGKKIENFEDLVQATGPRGGQETTYDVIRDGKQLSFVITPKRIEQSEDAKIGLMRKVQLVPVDVGTSLKLAVVVPAQMFWHQVKSIAHMIAARDSSGLKGPVGIVNELSRAAKAGAVQLLTMIMMLSVAIGFANLLPFPGLDGGRLTTLVYELVTRRKPNPKVEAVVHAVGILILLGVIVAVTWRDVANWAM